MARKASGILRSTAKKLLTQLALRAEKANDNPDFSFFVTRIAVFGSYLSTEKEKLGDLDVAVELVPRYSGMNQRRAEDEAIRLRGPRRSSIVERVIFPRTEVYRFLRNKSKCMSLHEYSELQLMNTDYLIIYERKPSSS